MQIGQISDLIFPPLQRSRGQFAKGHPVVGCEAPELGETAVDGDSLDVGCAELRVPQRTAGHPEATEATIAGWRNPNELDATIMQGSRQNLERGAQVRQAPCGFWIGLQLLLEADHDVGMPTPGARIGGCLVARQAVHHCFDHLLLERSNDLWMVDDIWARLDQTGCLGVEVQEPHGVGRWRSEDPVFGGRRYPLSSKNPAPGGQILDRRRKKAPMAGCTRPMMRLPPELVKDHVTRRQFAATPKLRRTGPCREACEDAITWQRQKGGSRQILPGAEDPNATYLGEFISA